VPVSGLARRLAPRLVAVLAIAAAVHALAIWAVPRAVMGRVIGSVAAEGRDGPLLPPPIDAGARRVVLPNPDLLYALCAYDVGAAPLRVRASPGEPGYWSIALYTAGTDTWFVLNDRQAAGRPVDLLVTGPGARDVAAPAGARAVASPTARGLLLMRVLVTDDAAQRAAAEAARRTLRCEPLG
jgi:uncharacterized membrane protein